MSGRFNCRDVGDDLHAIAGGGVIHLLILSLGAERALDDSVVDGMIAAPPLRDMLVALLCRRDADMTVAARPQHRIS